MRAFILQLIQCLILFCLHRERIAVFFKYPFSMENCVCVMDTSAELSVKFNNPLRGYDGAMNSDRLIQPNDQ